MRESRKRIRKLLSFALALAVGVTFIPLFGTTVSAAQTNAPQQDEIIVEDMPDMDLGDIDLGEAGLDPSGFEEHDAQIPEALPLDETQFTAASDIQPTDEFLEKVSESLGGVAKGAASDEMGGITLTENKSTGQLTISGEVLEDSFTNLFIFDMSKEYPEDPSGNLLTVINNSSFSLDLDMTVLPVGIYQFVVVTEGGRAYYDDTTVMFYKKPDNKQSRYETYSKYLFFKPPTKQLYYVYGTDSTTDYDSGLYVDIRAKGAKKWKTYGPIDSTSEIKGLKPNTKYYARTYYGKKVTTVQDNVTHFIKGTSNKKFKTVTIRTGKKSLPIKSVRAKAVSVKKYTHVRRGEYTGVYLGKETWYTYRIKVTVKMKKKPGVKAIYVNGRKLKGNKKTYSTTFSRVNSIMYGKHKVKKTNKWWVQYDYYNIPRGSKYTVAIYSYSNKAYKAFTPIQKRNTKLR